MKRFFSIAVAALCLSVAACHTPPASDTSLQAEAKATAGTFLTAVLCTNGGFDCETAPVRVDATVQSRAALFALNKGELSKEQAQAAHDKVAAVFSLLDAAEAACGQDNKTGQCTKDKRTAINFLGQA